MTVQNLNGMISFEGIDGAGKSSQIAATVALLRENGFEVVQTREPGGTPLGERLRELLLHEPMHLETEALLMFAARREHLALVIEPALARGAWVVSDRFADASYAYQVGGRGLDVRKFDALVDFTLGDFSPDLTLLFDIAPDVAASRLAAGREHADRFEREQRDFFHRVRAAYLDRARKEPGRLKVVDALRSVDEVTADVLGHVVRLVERKGARQAFA